MIGRNCSMRRGYKNSYKILLLRSQGKRPHASRCEYNIDTDLKKWIMKVRTGFIWLRTGRSCELLVGTTTELAGSTQAAIFPEKLANTSLSRRILPRN
jgi:hypothetical protein